MVAFVNLMRYVDKPSIKSLSLFFHFCGFLSLSCPYNTSVVKFLIFLFTTCFPMHLGDSALSRCVVIVLSFCGVILPRSAPSTNFCVRSAIARSSQCYFMVNLMGRNFLWFQFVECKRGNRLSLVLFVPENVSVLEILMPLSMFEKLSSNFYMCFLELFIRQTCKLVVCFFLWPNYLRRSKRIEILHFRSN